MDATRKHMENERQWHDDRRTRGKVPEALLAFARETKTEAKEFQRLSDKIISASVA
jgi:hypothetical protein